MPRNDYNYNPESQVSQVYSTPADSVRFDRNNYGSAPSGGYSPTMPASEGVGGGYGSTEVGDVGANDAGFGKTQVETEISEGVRRTVGWLVGIKGSCYGIDYHLHAGYNFIGRNSEYAVNLSDPTVSREPMVQVIYDDELNEFSIAPFINSQNAKICRLNGKMLAMHTMINPYDRIAVGNCELIFVPLCGEQFRWEEKPEEK